MTASPFVTPVPEIARDQWGRPMIPQANGGAVAYIRASKVAEPLKDMYTIQRWQKRKLMLGLAAEPDLMEEYKKLNPGDSAAIDDLVWRAEIAGGSTARANLGTLIHKWTENIDQGFASIEQAPAELQPDLHAYRAATSGLEVALVEQFVVEDTHQVAGTFDRLVVMDGEYFIADLKTGSTMDYPMEFAAQLAVYANGVPFDIATMTRGQWPGPVNTDKAIIIHLPAGEAHCKLYWIDIRKGWDVIVPLAMQVRQLRRDQRTALLREFNDTDLVRGAVMTAILAAPTLEVLQQIWYENQDTWTADHTAAAAARKASLTTN